MAQVTLAKALKLKNRLAQRVKEVSARIQASNSYLAGSEPDFDAKAELAELKELTRQLWETKQAINEANGPVTGLIYEMAELRGLVKFLRGLNTKRGRAVVGYAVSAPQDYLAQISAQESQAEITQVEARIDEIQDLLDAHNASTRIELQV